MRKSPRRCFACQEKKKASRNFHLFETLKWKEQIWRTGDQYAIFSRTQSLDVRTQAVFECGLHVSPPQAIFINILEMLLQNFIKFSFKKKAHSAGMKMATTTTDHDDNDDDESRDACQESLDC